MKNTKFTPYKTNPKPKPTDGKSGTEVGDSFVPAKGSKSIYERKVADRARRMQSARPEKGDEYDQRIIDVARVTRVMAGGKRMRFRACVAIGNKNGKVGLGIAKGADVTMAVTKAVNDAKKSMVDVSIVNDTIPHKIYQKYGAAKILLKPARQGKGVIAGGAVRLIMELAGIKNVTSKNLGTNNKVNVAKCTVLALSNLKAVQKKKEEKPAEAKESAGQETKKDDQKKS
jgi:small subunit ribosomal protein S5